MACQVRHKKFGVYQGSCMGMGFWHPLSDMPEQGFCEFPTHHEAAEFVRFLTHDASEPLNAEDLTIESFDYEASERLQVEGLVAMQEKEVR